jgi:spore coat polysaccharide biosynthesis protein SpsF (cytidylyltransferase family)
MNPLIIIQARLGSTRLPGKVLMPLDGEPMIKFMVDRLFYKLDRMDRELTLVVATPDQAVADAAETESVIGPEDDVAERFRMVLREFDCPTFIRLCGDSPLMDPALIDAAIALYEPPYLEIRSPVGCVEVCDTAEFLAGLPMMTRHEREHVTLRLRATGKSIHVGHGRHHPDGGGRLVVDTQEDFDRVAAVIEKMTKPHTDYGWRECVSLL